jgi:hypothetical protein
VAGAPATELPVIVRAAGSLPISGFLYMIIAGFNDAYPDEAPLSAVLTAEGEARLSVVDQACVGDVIDQFAGSDSSALLVPGGLTSGAWAALAEENDPGNVSTDAPVLIVHSAADNTVPAALSQLLADRMCDVGQVVERRVYDRGQSHVDAVPDAVNGCSPGRGERRPRVDRPAPGRRGPGVHLPRGLRPGGFHRWRRPD